MMTETKIQGDIMLNSHNFVIKFQEMLEKYYLQPLDGSFKKNLKDGHIERETHGAQHASRTALWVLLMHGVLKILIPKYVNTSFQKIAKHVALNEEQILLFILITMGAHDSAREGEGRDVWETKSFLYALNILEELGLGKQEARLFAVAIQFKDKPDEYLDELRKLGIKEDDINHFDYIRKIINIGDTIDIMRIAGIFNPSYLFNCTLNSIDEFEESHEDIIMQMLPKMAQFIHDQWDMGDNCIIIGSSAPQIAYHFSSIEKVNYEHAENVFITVFEEANKNEVFHPYLEDFKLQIFCPEEVNNQESERPSLK